MAPQQSVADIKAKLVASAAVATITIVEERLLPDRGYFRARLTLSNSDFLEVAEYFVVEAGRCMTRRYRYQWMDSISPPRETSLDRSPRETPALTRPSSWTHASGRVPRRAGAPARHWLRVIPSFFMRDRSVLGGRPRRAAVCPSPWAGHAPPDGIEWGR